MGERGVSPSCLGKPDSFYSALRADKLFGDEISPSEFQGVEAILDAAQGLPLSYVAYMLATAYLETAHTMQPIKEFGGEAYFTRRYDINGNNPALAKRLGNTQPGDGAMFAGRGFVQLTGRSNYDRADHELGLGGKLLANPGLAMQPEIAADIMRSGMVEGWFTGRKLKDWLNKDEGDTIDFFACRAIINGHDRAADIAGYAMQFQAALVAGEWA